MFLIPAIGGPERKVAEVNSQASHESGPFISWFPDSKWLATIDQPPGKPSAVFLVSVEDGEKKRLTAPPPNSIGDQNPAVSPDGRTLVFSRSLGGQTGDLYRLELSENLSPKDEPKRLTFDNASLGPAWTKDGHAIVFTSGSYASPSLWKIDMAQRRWRNGKAERLSFAGQDVRQPAISRNGRLAYARYPVNMNLWRLDLFGGSKRSVPGIRVEKAAIKLNASTRLRGEEALRREHGTLIAVAATHPRARWRCSRPA